MSKSKSLKHVPPQDPNVSPGLDPIPGGYDPDDVRECLLEDNSVPRLMAAAMLREALTPRQRRAIGKSNGIALVVEVAHPEMIGFVHDALRLAGDLTEVYRRDGSQRSSHSPAVGGDQVASLLGRGCNVAGISQSPTRYLPATLTAAADIRVKLGTPSQKTVRGIVHLVTGQSARGLGSVAGLSFLDICSAIRKGGKARDAVRRLAAMQAARRSSGAIATGRHLRDSHGYGQAKGWGLTLAAAVEEWRAGRRPWASIPDRNIVLGGPPGTGKTQFAVTLAATLGLPLVTTSAAAWFSSGGGYLNDVIKAVDAAFTEATANGPCVFLLDEIDAVPSRENLDSRHRDFWTPVVTAILLALDSTTSNAANLIVVGATNHPNRLDPALVRPGRLNRIIHIDLPDAGAVVGILRQHLGDDLPGADLTAFGVLGAGSSGAEIAGWAKSARAAALAAGRPMSLDDLVHVVAPPETRSPELLRAIAYHEGAHAVVTEVLSVGDVQAVTLVPQGSSGGRCRASLKNAAARKLTTRSTTSWSASSPAGPQTRCSGRPIRAPAASGCPTWVSPPTWSRRSWSPGASEAPYCTGAITPRSATSFGSTPPCARPSARNSTGCTCERCTWSAGTVGASSASPNACSRPASSRGMRSVGSSGTSRPRWCPPTSRRPREAPMREDADHRVVGRLGDLVRFSRLLPSDAPSGLIGAVSVGVGTWMALVTERAIVALTDQALMIRGGEFAGGGHRFVNVDPPGHHRHKEATGWGDESLLGPLTINAGNLPQGADARYRYSRSDAGQSASARRFRSFPCRIPRSRTNDFRDRNRWLDIPHQRIESSWLFASAKFGFRVPERIATSTRGHDDVGI